MRSDPAWSEVTGDLQGLVRSGSLVGLGEEELLKRLPHLGLYVKVGRRVVGLACPEHLGGVVLVHFVGEDLLLVRVVADPGV